MEFERSITLAGRLATVRVTRDETGELFIGSRDATPIVEELLVYDLGEDVGECDRLIEELRAVGTGASAASTRPFNSIRVELEPVTSRLRMQVAGADSPVEVPTRELHDLVAAFREFLVATTT
jgi:hypothetical protein